jgi:hypothetical protein
MDTGKNRYITAGTDFSEVCWVIPLGDTCLIYFQGAVAETGSTGQSIHLSEGKP